MARQMVIKFVNIKPHKNQSAVIYLLHPYGLSCAWNTLEEMRPNISPFWSQHIEGLLDPSFLHLGLLLSASSLSASFPMVHSTRSSLHSATQFLLLVRCFLI